MKVIDGVTHFFTHTDKYGMLITKTTNQAVIDKLSGVNGKKAKHWKWELDEDGNKIKKLPKIKNHKWTDEDGVEHGNDEEYVPLDKPVHEILAEADEEEE